MSCSTTFLRSCLPHAYLPLSVIDCHAMLEPDPRSPRRTSPQQAQTLPAELEDCCSVIGQCKGSTHTRVHNQPMRISRNSLVSKAQEPTEEFNLGPDWGIFSDGAAMRIK